MTGQRSELLNRRVDYHCHLLPGLDDGARHLDDSLAMARILVAAGFETVHCTPHCIRGVYDTTQEQVYEAVIKLQTELNSAEIRLNLLSGMEYYLDEYFPQALETPVPLGGSKLLLVEAPHNAHPQLVQENIFIAVRKGFTPVFAHPERTPFLIPEKKGGGMLGKLCSVFNNSRQNKDSASAHEKINMLRQQGCLFQGNLGSFAVYYGREIQNRALLFQRCGIYDCFGSDAHRPEPLNRCLENVSNAYSIS